MIEHLTEKTSFNQIYKLGLENRNLFIFYFFSHLILNLEICFQTNAFVCMDLAYFFLFILDWNAVYKVFCKVDWSMMSMLFNYS